MIVIDGLQFDLKRGTILLRERDAIPFRSSYNNGVGVQVTPMRGVGFTLTLTRFDKSLDVVAVRNSFEMRIGKTVYIVDYLQGRAINYMLPQYGQSMFMVSQARIVEQKIVTAFNGYRFGQLVKIEPALKTVSQWTMYAVDVSFT